MYTIGAVKGRMIRWMLSLMLLLAAGGGAWLWWHVNSEAKRLLLPGNPLFSGYNDLPDRAQGVELQSFEITGWDGAKVQACIVRKANDQEGLTPRQHTLLEKLEGLSLKDLEEIDYALISVDWDHGIRSALPLAEAMAAAGVTCVLWEPRGSNSARSFCTHGLHESADVPLLIDNLEKATGRKDLLIVGVGRGFGAELMLQAAACEPRLHAVVAIDAAASLNKILKRANVSAPMRELIGWRMNQLTGLEPFDIAAVKSASLIQRDTPVLIAHSGANVPAAGSLDDSVAIYTQLQSDQRKLITPRNEQDEPDATTRTIVYATVGGTREIVQEVEVSLVKDADDILVEILKWLSAYINPQMDSSSSGAALLPTRNTP